jgi:hypothetical protein
METLVDMILYDFVQYYDPKWLLAPKYLRWEVWAFWRSGRSGREWAYYKHKAF